MKDIPEADRLKAAPKHERHFYATNRAFGRFGMRIFEPQTMDKPHWHGHVEANFGMHHIMGYDVDNEPVVVPPGRLAVASLQNAKRRFAFCENRGAVRFLLTIVSRANRRYRWFRHSRCSPFWVSSTGVFNDAPN